MKNSLTIFLMLLANLAFAENKILQNNLDEEVAAYAYFSIGQTAYLFGDAVRMRDKPTLESSVLSKLPIGTKVEILDSANTQVIQFVKSAFYKVKTTKGEGWIWGGLIAQGQSVDKAGEYTFLIAFNGKAKKIVEKTDEEDYSYWRPYVETRVLKNGTLVEQKEILFQGNELSYLGDEGGEPQLLIENLTQGLIIVNYSTFCEYCGCRDYTYYLFWNGKGFTDTRDVMGFVDAWASEGQTFIFPKDTLENAQTKIIGEKDFLILYENTMEQAEEDIPVVKVLYTADYYQWNGQKLVLAGQKKGKKGSFYFDYDAQKVVPKPQNWTPVH